MLSNFFSYFGYYALLAVQFCFVPFFEIIVSNTLGIMLMSFVLKHVKEKSDDSMRFSKIADIVKSSFF